MRSAIIVTILLAGCFQGEFTHEQDAELITLKINGASYPVLVAIGIDGQPEEVVLPWSVDVEASDSLQLEINGVPGVEYNGAFLEAFVLAEAGTMAHCSLPLSGDLIVILQTATTEMLALLTDLRAQFAGCETCSPGARNILGRLDAMLSREELG